MFSQAPAEKDEVDQRGEAILNTAGWWTKSQMFSDAVCSRCSSISEVGIRFSFKLPWRMPSRDVFI